MKKVKDISADQYEHGPGYYLRSWYRLYPGFINFSAPHFLNRYYEARKSEMSAIAVLINLIVFLIFRLRYAIRFGVIERRYRLGKKWRRQARSVASGYLIDPHDIALFRIENKDQLHNHMRRFEDAQINKFINPRGWRRDCILGSKIAFHNICADFGLPHPQILATGRGKQIEIYNLPAEGQFILKPAGGNGGCGFQLVDFDPRQENAEQHMRERILSLTGRDRRSWIAQPRLQSHPGLTALAGSALITARLTTMLNEQNQPEIVTSVLRFPQDSDSLVDNIKSGGLMAPIDAQSGQLGQGRLGRGIAEYSHHPTSGAEITGISIPEWSKVKELAITAHAQAFADYSIIGWDIAPTPKGPIILEGDGRPGINLAQGGHGKGMGEMRMGQLIAYHIDRILAAQNNG